MMRKQPCIMILMLLRSTKSRAWPGRQELQQCIMNVLRQLVTKQKFPVLSCAISFNSLNGEASRWLGTQNFSNACINAPLSGGLDAPENALTVINGTWKRTLMRRQEKPDVPNLSNLGIDRSYASKLVFLLYSRKWSVWWQIQMLRYWTKLFCLEPILP